MTLLWVGSAPGVRLFNGQESTAWAGVYQVDWSIRGAGIVLALWQDSHRRVLGTSSGLSEWMIDTFMAPMSRSAALGSVSWGSVAYETAPVEVEIDLDTGVRATSSSS